MNEQLIRKYADLIVTTGLNVREGQPVMVRAEVANREFARALAAAAYGAGAAFVDVRFEDPGLLKTRIERTTKADYLSYVPSFSEGRYERMLEEDWGSVSLRGSEDPDLLDDCDPAGLGKIRQAVGRARSGFLAGISSNRIAWNVCLYPTERWSAKVLGSYEGWEEEIWKVLAPILRLDRDDPSRAWLEQDAELKRRAGFMDSHLFDRIHFKGPGTDLYVGMRPDRRFRGGMCTSKSGIRFFPNIPTEEIFSTPDLTRTRGRFRCTRPVEVLGKLVEDAWFEFEEGKVTSFGAARNAEILERFLEMDDNARYLGEVALVDIDSPIYESGRIFYNILFDENAACHVALGNGYSDCLEGGTSMGSEELLKAGCNVSLVHTDFMLGSEEVSVYGVDEGGSEKPIIVDGRFVI
jgi:aminopeptidase